MPVPPETKGLCEARDVALRIQKGTEATGRGRRAGEKESRREGEGRHVISLRCRSYEGMYEVRTYRTYIRFGAGWCCREDTGEVAVNGGACSDMERTLPPSG